MVGGGGDGRWWWWLRPILVFSLSLDQAEQFVSQHRDEQICLEKLLENNNSCS